MASNFWHNPGVEPKRNFRFQLHISAAPELTWLVKTCEKPKVNVSTVPHKFINHTFNYPGRVVWNPVAITLVDTPFGDRGDTSQTAVDFLRQSGYRVPLTGQGGGDAETNLDRAATNIEKELAVNALGGISAVTIEQLQNLTDGTGPGVIDRWTLHNAVITGDINFGTLDYASEDLTTVSFTFQYDWATFNPQPTT
tara:strand:+ start:243 stop:830 length:588 start_codon:yes stop_codon:yes gene_type:complete